MAAIINALFGTYPDPEPQNVAANQTVVDANTTTSSERLHTSAVSDDVHVKSVISSETQSHATISNKLDINNLLSQLSTTHSQVDQYSRARTAEINDQVKKSIADVLANTQRQQEELLRDANQRHSIIDSEYKVQLQKAVEGLDAVKAKTLAELEHDLHGKQQIILAEAKRQVDALNDQANAAKLHVLVEAQEQAKQDVAHITDQVGILGQQDAQHLLQSTTTTIITSKSQATGHPEPVVTVPVTETTTTTITSQQQKEVVVPVDHTQVASSSVSAPAVTQESTTAFGSVTGASDLTTTPAVASTTSTNVVATEVKPPHDNTAF